MTRVVALPGVSCLLIGLPLSARSQDCEYVTFPLDPFQVVPGPGGPGHGWAWFNVCATGIQGAMALSTSDSITAVHLHGPAGFGAQAPVLFELAVSGAGATPIELSIALTDTLREWFSGMAVYLDVHTISHPDGALRGQVGRVAILPRTWSSVRQLYR